MPPNIDVWSRHRCLLPFTAVPLLSLTFYISNPKDHSHIFVSLISLLLSAPISSVWFWPPHPVILKVVATLLKNSSPSAELMEVRRLFLSDMIKLFSNSRENRRWAFTQLRHAFTFAIVLRCEACDSARLTLRVFVPAACCSAPCGRTGCSLWDTSTPRTPRSRK